MKQTAQTIKEDIMLLEQKLETYKNITTMNCNIVSIVTTRIEKQLDELYLNLLEMEANEE